MLVIWKYDDDDEFHHDDDGESVQEGDRDRISENS